MLFKHRESPNAACCKGLLRIGPGVTAISESMGHRIQSVSAEFVPKRSYAAAKTRDGYFNNCVKQRPIALVQASDDEYIGAKIGAVWVSRMNDIVTADYVPSEDEPFMNERQKSYFRSKLVTWKNDILREARETLEILQQENANHPDLADRASSETDRAIELRARDRQRKLIAKIDSALQRIDEGTYGYCEETGEPIALKRLDARPIATLSIEAQERHERREKVYRDD